jgi:hypothetical protein
MGSQRMATFENMSFNLTVLFTSEHCASANGHLMFASLLATNTEGGGQPSGGHEAATTESC